MGGMLSLAASKFRDQCPVLFQCYSERGELPLDDGKYTQKQFLEMADFVERTNFSHLRMLQPLTTGCG